MRLSFLALILITQLTPRVMAAPTFVRGDTNSDGTISLADPVQLLNYLFVAGGLSCEDAGDTNDDPGCISVDVIGERHGRCALGEGAYCTGSAV